MNSLEFYGNLLKDISIRIWYMEKIIENGWSRDTLSMFTGRLCIGFFYNLPDGE